MARARSWLKISGILALIAVLGAGAVLVALKAFFPEPKARAYAIAAARKQLGREVRLSRIVIGLTGLRLQGLEISERPDFASGTFLTVATFSLRPSWKALLRRKLVVVSASADGLKVTVVKNEDGSFNYDTLASSAPAAGAAAPPDQAAAAPDLKVRRLRVTNGEASYRDAAGAAWAVTGLSLKLDDFSLDEPFDLDVSLRAKGKAGDRPVDASLSFAGKVDLARGSRDKFTLDFKSLSVEQEGLKLAAKGKVTGLDAPEAALDATLSASGKTLLTASGTLRASMPSENGARAVDADLKLETPELDTTLLAKWAPGSAIPAVAIPAASAALAARWEGASAEVKSFRVSWAEGKIEGLAFARGLGTKAPDYGGRAKFGVDVAEIRAGQYAFLKLPPKSFIPAMRVDGEASYAGGDLTLSSLEAKFKQGAASASGVVRRLGSAKPAPDLALSFAVDLPSFKLSDLPVALSTTLPGGYVVPATRLDGGARVRGDDVSLEKVVIKGKSGTLRLDGLVAKALTGAPEPALEVRADLDLPALTDKDLLLFPGVPPGLELPPSRWDADLSYSAAALRFRKFDVKIASNELSVTGGVADPLGRGSFDLLILGKRFVLDELTRMTPQTRDLKLSGSGVFKFELTGTKEKPVGDGKIRFRNLGATVAELPLSDFSGEIRITPHMINIPDLKGKVADGALSLFTTIEDYSKSPRIEVTASLDRFDLGRYLAAKKKVEAASKAQAEKAGKPADAKPAAPLRVKGKVEIGSLIHPNAQLRGVTASWNLWGVTPDMKKLNGEAQIGAGGGRLHALGDLALQSKVAKVLLYPFLIVQKLAIGVNLNDIDVLGIAGDYVFEDGLMTLRKSELDAGQIVQVSTLGTIDLPSERLNLNVSAQVGTLPGADIAVTGTASDPKTKVNYKKILENAGQNLLDKILPRR